jgi:hypothetical protein
VLAVLRATARTDGHARLAHELELSESALRRYLKTGRARPTTHACASRHAVSLAHAALVRRHPGEPLPTDPATLLYLATRKGGPFTVPRCAGCNKPLRGRQRRWCRDCRVHPRQRRRRIA